MIMAALLNCRVKCALKYLAFVILFVVILVYLRSVNDVASPVVRAHDSSSGYKNRCQYS
jgi:hypothetical protein